MLFLFIMILIEILSEYYFMHLSDKIYIDIAYVNNSLCTYIKIIEIPIKMQLKGVSKLCSK